MPLFFIFYSLVYSFQRSDYFAVPIRVSDRNDIHRLTLTDIGAFGIDRKDRPQVPAHLHTGIDIKRPSSNYIDEKIYSITSGIVISKRTDGPYAQLIIEHDHEELVFWTVYEHIAGIEVSLFQQVQPDMPIARFFNHEELDQFGWQFDHFHFEILKQPPQKITPSPDNPERLFHSYTLTCYTPATLNRYFYDPVPFLRERL